MITPERGVSQGAGLGITAVYPQNVIVAVKSSSPAAAAGIQANDLLLAVNGSPPMPMDTHPRQVDFRHNASEPQTITQTLQRGSEQWQVTVTADLFAYESQPVSRALAIVPKQPLT